MAASVVIILCRVREGIDELIAEQPCGRRIAEERALEISDGSIHEQRRVPRNVGIVGEDLRRVLLLEIGEIIAGEYDDGQRQRCECVSNATTSPCTGHRGLSPPKKDAHDQNPRLRDTTNCVSAGKSPWSCGADPAAGGTPV